MPPSGIRWGQRRTLMYKMKLNGVLEINEPLEKEKDYSMVLKRVALKDIVTRENESSKVITFIMENQDIVTLIGEDKVIEAKPTKFTQSQILRFVIEKNWEDQHSGHMEKQEYYNKIIGEIIENERSRYQ